MVLLIAGSLLLAGCRSAPEWQAAGSQGKPVSAAKRERMEEESVERAAAAHAHYAAGVIHEMNGEAQEAAEEYYQAVMLDPSDEALVLEVSGGFLRGKQPQKALEVVTRAVAQPNASGQVYARLGTIYAELGKPNEAVAANRVAISKSPGALFGYQNLCQGYLAKRQPEEALKVLDEAARQPKPDAEFLVGLAELYTGIGLQSSAHKDGASVKARALLNRAAKQGVRTPLLRLKLADNYNVLGDSTEAAQFYLEVLKEPPDLPLIQERVRANLTSIYLRGSDHKRASEQLEAILRDDPTNPQAHYYLGRMALEDKKPAEAAEALSKTVLLSPDFESAYYYLAVAQIELKKPGEALATLEKARQKFAQSFALEYYTALAYNGLKSYPEALRHFVAAEVIAKATDPSQLSEGFYFQLGAASERKGDYDQAEAYFQKSLQLAPDFAEAMNYLGYMWTEQGVKLERARELIEKAVKAEPKNAAFLDSLAWVLFKLNHPAEALPHALKAAELSESPDATVYDHIGDIYAALQQPEKACEAWRKSLLIEPNPQVSKKLEASGTK